MDSDFGGRDRITRAPKSLGFVQLKPVIKLTAAGERLLAEKRTDEIFTRQLLKFQLPSPYHPLPSTFFVRPYLAFLRLLKSVEHLSKHEVAAFFTQLTHLEKFEMVKKMILDYRKEAEANKGSRKVFEDKALTEQVRKIYRAEIENEDYKVRENKELSLDKFIKTKKNNLRDSADAIMRYMRATRLITFEAPSFRAKIASDKTAEVDYILNTVEQAPRAFQNAEGFYTYLFDAASPTLLQDDAQFLHQKLSMLGVSFDSKIPVEELKDLVSSSEALVLESVIEQTEQNLKHFQEFDDIVELFGKIIGRDHVPDRALFLEWNTWRALVMLNYAERIQPNLSLDFDGMPVSVAKGGVADIEANYDGFKLLVEVTTSTGETQYKMEGEPVARHFGSVQRNTPLPVYCLFISPQINRSTLSYFFVTNRTSIDFYGGLTRIIPLNIRQFSLLLTIAKEKDFNQAAVLKNLFDQIIEKGRTAANETEWLNHIEQAIPSWNF